MLITTIAYITLLVATLFALVALTRWDLHNMQQTGYSNSRYNAGLMQSGEFSSPKRILAFAVLIGSFTTMALGSWMVVMVLAGIVAILGFVMLFRRDERPLIMSGRAIRLYAVTLLLALAIVAAVFFVGQAMGLKDIANLRNASTCALALLALSPMLIIAANWLLHPLEKHPDYGRPNDNKNQ
jgi:hypothetical protein